MVGTGFKEIIRICYPRKLEGFLFFCVKFIRKKKAKSKISSDEFVINSSPETETQIQYPSSVG